MTPSQPQPQHEDNVFNMHIAAMREMSEPRDGVSPTPVSYIIACFLFILWGGWYIGHYGGDWTGTGMSERASSGPVVPPPPQNPMILGKEVFGSCIQCHQETGQGMAGSVPPLVNSEFVTGDPRRLAAILLNGLNGEFVVNGQTYNSQMPAWGAVRDDEEIAAVLTYIRVQWGNKAPAISREFVASVRKEIDGKGEWRAATLAEFAKSAPPASALPATTPPAAPAPAVTK
jgi:mono/diheme cytochrome c family protein